jgi:Tol biopolymer transport system component
VSSDGRRIYYTKSGGEAEIWSVSPEGGDERRVSGFPGMPEEFTYGFALGASGVYFMNPKPPVGIDFFDFTNSRVTRVVDLPGRPAPWASLTISPDGRRLLFSQIDSIASDIMLIDKFR